jgi:CheY-like chemotaxis protein/HPt (histidine-containing phosphotransfer) domain-containing protein
MQILLIEDDEGVRAGLAALLSDDADVTQARNGREALELMGHGYRPSVIVLDLMMPVMDGWEFRVEQRRRADIAAIPVVAITANTSAQARALDADALVEKPFHWRHLVEVIHSVYAASERRREMTRRFAEAEATLCVPSEPRPANGPTNNGGPHALPASVRDFGSDVQGALARARPSELSDESGPRSTGPVSPTSGATRRYRLLRRIGAGGAGRVYEAFDSERRMLVALKTLSHLDAKTIYRFKREFRTMADMSHPNLVQLYDLVSDGEKWCLAMELLSGKDLRFSPNDRDLAAVRSAFGQLAQGLIALHDAGLLHRDVKASNVIETTDGRIVLVDFGIVANLKDADDTDLGEMLGTPAYMAPEQCTGDVVTAAADWYAFGVMLFEALTGSLPFTGRVHEVLGQKLTRDAPRARSIRGDVPEDLDALCAELLDRSPDARPRGRDVLQRVTTAGAHARRVSTRPPPDFAFVGRGEIRQTLHTLLEERQAVMAFVHGTSGMGKTAVVERFLDEARALGALVLADRCYERESVPYKAVDGVVDRLARYLTALSPEARAKVLPDDMSSLAQIFPLLGELGEEPLPPPTVTDAQEKRARAFTALRELLSGLARGGPLVIFIDDVQWGDADSAALVAALCADPSPPAILWILSYRTEHAGAMLAQWRMARRGTPGHVREVTLPVDALGPDDSAALAASLLGCEKGDPRAIRIAVESGGSPFFIGELARHAAASPAKGAELHLETVVRDRVARLATHERHLLDVVSIAGAPLAVTVATRAASLAPEECSRAFERLRVGNLLRSADTVTFEPFHDRVREAVVAGIGATKLRAYHKSLLDAFEQVGSAAPEALYHHALAADLRDRAAVHARAAAADAMRALAFVRAAELFRAAIDLSPPDAPDLFALRCGLAGALTNAGKGLDRIDLAWRALRQDHSNEAAEEELYQAIHSLKSDARVMGFADVQMLCQRLEDLITLARTRRYRVHEDVDIVAEMAVQFLAMLLLRTPGTERGGIDLDGFLKQLERVIAERLEQAEPREKDDDGRDDAPLAPVESREYSSGKLVIAATISGKSGRVVFRGESDARDPAPFLANVTAELLPRLEGKKVVIDFQPLRGMNSSTVASILILIRALDERRISAVLNYDTNVAWQRVNFQCMKAIAKSLRTISVIGK